MIPERIFSNLIAVAPDIDSWTLSEFMEEMPAISEAPLHVMKHAPDFSVRLSMREEPLSVILVLFQVPESPSSFAVPDNVTARLSPEKAPPDTLIRLVPFNVTLGKSGV